ncbi:Signal transduction histidine kinase [Nonlabens sp. Hel1_33_55]|uniref:tetratricopeptide repeat-containing hybrid sensor histidine kinase/response regulator n=1 Tax=Nonlabens sp. Hel1_33_55 TaxID=1336802 RepID=UPI000875CAE6|nr:response regulator [Nonlabens sp. Hel1_33_55]SCX98409.1 Signal transduction histidine kinase [Nonlabens sp. Hel1_33_55]
MRLFLFYAVLLSSSHSLFAQKEPSKRRLPDPPYNFSVQELDSVLELAYESYFEGNYVSILQKAPDLIDYAEEIDELQIKTRLRAVLGNAFIQLGDRENAAALYKEALKEAAQRKDTFQFVNTYINLGNTYFDTDEDLAINYYTKALELGKNGSRDPHYIIIHHNLAEIYVKRDQPGKAQFHLDNVISALDDPSITNRKEQFIPTSQSIQGSIYLIQELYYRSIESSLQALENDRDDIDESYRILAYKNLLTAYEKTRQFELLSDVHKVYDSLITNRYENEKIRQQQLANSKYKADRYRQELVNSEFETKLMKQQTEQDETLIWTFAILGLLLLILISTLLYTREKRNKLLKILQIKNAQYLEAKDQSEKLAQKNTKFLSTISHELRTPLYGIIGLSSVFLNDKELDKYDEEFNSLKFSADYLLSLVNDILNINKFESEKGRKLQEEHFNLSLLMNSIVQSFQFLNQKNNNTLTLQIDPRIPEVLYGDKTKLSQVIMNLLSNASKFTLDGSITITVDQKTNDGKNTTLSFAVEDTGRGIEESNQKEVFEEFTQVPATISEGGTGLGLPIVNKLLKILNSQLEMDSTYGIGTTFSFVLPLKIGSKQEMESTINDRDIKKLDHKKLLIVDDNKINQLVTQKVLEQYHLDHDTANNGQEAVDMVKANSYDYILMDINMPVMNGIDATIEIRNLGIETPIIALTAADDLNLERDIYGHGINSILVKPYHTEQLLALLINHMS